MDKKIHKRYNLTLLSVPITSCLVWWPEFENPFRGPLLIPLSSLHLMLSCLLYLSKKKLFWLKFLWKPWQQMTENNQLILKTHFIKSCYKKNCIYATKYLSFLFNVSKALHQVIKWSELHSVKNKNKPPFSSLSITLSFSEVSMNARGSATTSRTSPLK